MVMTITLIVSCDDDDAPAAFTIQAITAGSIDLNGATSPTNVPVDPVITVTFTTDVDPATVNNTNIKLLRDYDAAEIPITVAASGSSVTIQPDDNLATGALYKLDLTAGLESTQGVPFVAASDELAR